MVRIRSKEAYVICYIVIGFVLNKLWTLFPESDYEYDFFLYNDTCLNFRLHLYFMLERVYMMILIRAIFITVNRYHFEINFIFILCTIDFYDYFLFYCEPLFYLDKYPIEYGLIKGIFMVLICANVLRKEF